MSCIGQHINKIDRPKWARSRYCRTFSSVAGVLQKAVTQKIFSPNVSSSIDCGSKMSVNRRRGSSGSRPILLKNSFCSFQKAI
jgi:hypothetical protein